MRPQQRRHLCDVETCQREATYKSPIGRGRLCARHFQTWQTGCARQAHFPRHYAEDGVSRGEYYADWLGRAA